MPPLPCSDVDRKDFSKLAGLVFKWCSCSETTELLVFVDQQLPGPPSTTSFTTSLGREVCPLSLKSQCLPQSHCFGFSSTFLWGKDKWLPDVRNREFHGHKNYFCFLYHPGWSRWGWGEEEDDDDETNYIDYRNKKLNENKMPVSLKTHKKNHDYQWNNNISSYFSCPFVIKAVIENDIFFYRNWSSTSSQNELLHSRSSCQVLLGHQFRTKMKVHLHVSPSTTGGDFVFFIF